MWWPTNSPRRGSGGCSTGSRCTLTVSNTCSSRARVAIQTRRLLLPGCRARSSAHQLALP
jgi:hypothetical protein